MMKKIIISLLFVAFAFNAIAQTDKNGNPVFNSITISEEKFEKYSLSSNYYTLTNNIENPSSSVFINAKPTDKQVIDASLKLMPYFFVVTNQNKASYMILIITDPNSSIPKYKIASLEIAKNKWTNFVLKTDGEIAEHRSNELIKNPFKTYVATRLDNGKFTYADNSYKILNFSDLKMEIIKLIDSKKLYDTKAKSGVTFLPDNYEDLKKFVIEESKNNGKFDFWTKIKKDGKSSYNEGGTFFNPTEFSQYLWGISLSKVGIKTMDDVAQIYEELKGIKMTEQQKEIIEYGFKKQMK